MKNKSGDSKKLLPKVKKEIKDFCFSEEGRISKKSIIQMGLTLIILGIAIDPVQACHVNNALPNSHSNSLFPTGQGGHSSATHASHASHPSHTSHGSHGSHGQW